MTKFTVLLPIHNEAFWLLYSLPSIFALKPDEVLCLLDHCSDDSSKVAKDLAFKYRVSNKLKLVEVNEDSPEWFTRLGYLRFLGRKLASNDLLFFTGADLVLDSEKIKDAFRLLGKDGVQLVTFMYKDYPPRWSNMLKRFYIWLGIQGLSVHKFLGGILFYNRRVAWKVENLESLKRCNHSCDTHLCMAINSRYRSKCVLTDTVHLRPRGRERDYLRGQLYWSIAHRGWITTFLASLGMLQPNIIKGYIHERYGKN